MKNLLKPYWLIAIATLPQIIMCILFGRVYYFISTELTGEQKNYWLIFAIVTAVLILAAASYAAYSVINKKSIGKWHAVVMLAVQIVYLYLFIALNTYIFPWSIPTWMFFGIEPLVVALTAMMPGIIYAILVCVVHFTPDEGHKIYKDIIAAIAIPLGTYLLFPLFDYLYFEFDIGITDFLWDYVIVIFFVVVTVLLIFFLIRIVYGIARRKSRKWTVATVLIGLVFPTLGLLLNDKVAENAMGDFSNIYFYIIAAANGIILLLPKMKDISFRVILFFLKSVFLVYVLYFAVVFMPYVPFSMIAVLFFGVGLLLLAPILLMIIQIKSLYDDFIYLKENLGKAKESIIKIAVIFAAGIITIPAVLTASFYADKHNINQALEYIYERPFDDTSEININEKSLRSTIEKMKIQGDSRNNLFGIGTPYIDGYYNYIVLDGATLGAEKISIIQQVFFQEEEKYSKRPKFINPDAAIADYTVETEYDEGKGVYRAWVHLEIKNESKISNEYVGEIILPSGCYISDYYLYVGEEKKHGLIADKRAANWIYEQITTVTRRDPGILSYESNDEIAFRVYPFEIGETRKTGIEFVYTEPQVVQIDEIEIELKTTGETIDTLQIGDNACYISAAEKEQKEQIYREPLFYFLVDYSKENGANAEKYIAKAKEFMEVNGIDESDAKIYFVNYNIYRADDEEDIDKILNSKKPEGGYYMDRAIKQIYYDNYTSGSDRYPVIIGLTRTTEALVILDDYDKMAFAFPDSEFIYFIGKENTVVSRSLITGGGMRGGFYTILSDQKPVVEYTFENGEKRYLSANGQGSIAINSKIEQGELNEYAGNKWLSASAMQAKHMNMMLRKTDVNSTSLEIIRGSISANVMTPLSSFIVLETQAQEKALLEKQKQILSSEKQYLSDEESNFISMAEPPIWLMAAAMIGIIALKNRRKKRA
ncbi:MAG: MSEP-CTERM sorting domain-containing protein [Eubacteriales bacterium]